MQPHQQLMTQPTLSTASAGSSSSQHQNQTMASSSPLSQYTQNGERQTTPPHHLSSTSQSQLQGNYFEFGIPALNRIFRGIQYRNLLKLNHRLPKIINIFARHRV